jgi:predicted N-acyltransferase
MMAIAHKLEVSSLHITFMEREEAEALGTMGFLQRHDQQFHWHNEGYPTFDAFLAALSSIKRKNLRRERAEALRNNITVEWVTGRDLKEHHWDAFFAFYMDTGSRKWGSPYLTRKFFSLVGQSMADHILLVLAKRHGRYIAGALNFIGSDTLYGRNWGAIEHHPFLHFELCYYQAIDFAIAKGLKVVEAGAQGAHKLARGYLPARTQSAHWIAHAGLREGVARYLKEERRAVGEEMEALSEHSPFRKNETTP